MRSASTRPCRDPRSPLAHAGAVGISQRLLTLRKLERDGLVERTVFAVIPPRVEYALSPLGRTLITPVTALADWAVTHHDAIKGSRARYDTDRPEHP